MRLNLWRAFCVLLLAICLFDSAASNEVAKGMTDSADQPTFEWRLKHRGRTGHDADTLRRSIAWLAQAHGGDGSPTQTGHPADDLSPHIRRITWFGERPDWSHDGKRILFVSGAFGVVYEYELESGRIKPLSLHFKHYGFTRALYLANGDILPRIIHQLD